MRTALICHHDNFVNREGLTRWMASFSEVVGVVVITETAERKRRRFRAEWRRSRWRIVDVLAFQVYYRLFLARGDRAWITDKVTELRSRYPAAVSAPIHHTSDPNLNGTVEFLKSVAPDIVVARCKTLLRPEVFTVPPAGTVVLHPGVCPEYRNAHGCFWALARRDLDHVGATLLRIDPGIDTGPVFAYYTSDVDERRESHVVIEHRVVLDNLDAVQRDLAAIVEATATAIDTTGRPSAVWGQPRLSDYISWKRAARAATP